VSWEQIVAVVAVTALLVLVTRRGLG